MNAKAIVQIGYQGGEVAAENLSMTGAFVTPVRQMAVNDVVRFTILHTNIKTKAKVVRVSDRGVGLALERTLLE